MDTIDQELFRLLANDETIPHSILANHSSDPDWGILDELVTVTMDKRKNLHEHLDDIQQLWKELIARRPRPIQTLAFLSLLPKDGRRAISIQHADVNDRVASFTTQVSDDCRLRLKDHPDPRIRSLPSMIEAYKMLALGRLLPCMRLANEVLTALPRSATIRRTMLSHFSIRLALQGLLKDFEPFWVNADWSPSPNSLFTDAVERGDLATAAAHQIAASQQVYNHPQPSEHKVHRSYANLAQVMKASLSGRMPVLPEDAGGARGMHRDLARIVALQSGETDHSAVNLDGNVLSASLHCALAPIHCALARRQLSMARLFLEQRAQHVVMTPSDALAWAMLNHLEGNSPAVAHHMDTALSAGVHYGALRRLDFDLRMVPGMSLSTLLCQASPKRAPFLPATAPPMAVVMAQQDGSDSMIGESSSMQALRSAIAVAAREDDIPALLIGETGTGKELAAQLIHRQGPRSKLPFIAVNCAAVADDLLLAELFGHAKGAFTGSTGERGGLITEAASGTIFLDEIGDASPRLQAALLRLLENGEYRRLGDDRVRSAKCRVITATNVNLAEAAELGRFRRDLRFRLERMVLRLPPLRERASDIPLLLRHWLLGSEIDQTLVDHLMRLPWPGNIRELRNACERVLRHGGVRRIDLETWTACNPEDSRQRTPPPVTNPAVREPPAMPPAVHGPMTSSSGRLRLHGSERLDQLRALFKVHGRLTRQEVMLSLGIAGTTATADLQALCRDGVIEKVEPSPAPRTHYFRLIGG